MGRKYRHSIKERYGLLIYFKISKYCPLSELINCFENKHITLALFFFLIIVSDFKSFKRCAFYTINSLL